jgi:SAM-dependent methyltransferase
MNDKCMLCGSELSIYNNLYLTCNGCFSVFVKDIPTHEEIDSYYKNYFSRYHGGGRSKGALERQKSYAKKYFKVLERYSGGNTLIDVGSANNPFPNIACSNKYKVSIVDINKPKNLCSYIQFFKSSIEDLNLPSAMFDNVTAMAIIEHTRFPLKALESLAKLTKKHGTLIIYIPEAGRFPDKFALGTSKWLYPPEHLNLLSGKGLIEAMRKNKCELITSYRFELNLIRFFLRYGIGYIEGALGWLVKLINQNYWQEIRQKRKHHYKGMEIFIFKKQV